MSGNDDLPPCVSQTGIPAASTKLCKFFRSLRIDDAATGDHQRLLCAVKRLYGSSELIAIRSWPSRRPHALIEEAFRVVIGFGLHILAKRQRHGTAFRRIGQHCHCPCQRGDDLLGPGDAIEIARNRTKAVIGRNGTIAEGFHLLQDGIGDTIGEDVAGQKQQRQPVDMRQSSSSYHVGRTGADRTRHRHHAAAKTRLGKGNGGMGHCLLVMGAVGRQFFPDLIQRLAEPRDIAMAENGPDAGENRHLLAVDYRHLLGEEARQCLRHRQAYRLGHVSLLPV